RPCDHQGSGHLAPRRGHIRARLREREGGASRPGRAPQGQAPHDGDHRPPSIH
ncbi:unnamed protein product, partial [Ectocarpus sp. 12 AP-2014]